MRQIEVLVGELLAVDGLAARAVLIGEVAALAHEVRDHAVERAALVAEASLLSVYIYIYLSISLSLYMYIYIYLYLSLTLCMYK